MNGWRGSEKKQSSCWTWDYWKTRYYDEGTTPIEAIHEEVKVEGRRRLIMSEKSYPFVFVVDYQYKGHLYFGVWDEKLQLYEFGDGDYHTVESVREMSDSVHFMGWPDVEQCLGKAILETLEREVPDDEFFVMLSTPNGEMIPMVDGGGDLIVSATEVGAVRRAKKTFQGRHYGFEVFQLDGAGHGR